MNFSFVDIIVGWVLGVLSSVVGFFITYRSNWRNWLTKEFTVSIKIDSIKGIVEYGKEIPTEITIKCVITCTNEQALNISSIYFNLPDDIKGNNPSNPTLGEALFESRGRYYVPIPPFLFSHSDSRTISLNRETDRRIFDEIETKNLKKIIFIAETSKYGNVKSNCIDVSNIF